MSKVDTSSITLRAAVSYAAVCSPTVYLVFQLIPLFLAGPSSGYPNPDSCGLLSEVHHRYQITSGDYH
jgi:hypothetical protein